MLKAFEMTLGGATQRLAVVYDEGVRRTPIGGFDKAPFAAEYRTMEIHQLRYFVAVAEEGSFSNAAEREHVSQPSCVTNISRTIHSFAKNVATPTKRRRSPIIISES